MKANIRFLLERFIREGIDHTFLNTDVEVSKMDAQRLANELDNRIWLYIDEYFTFDEND
jgi:hypothetical protein